MAARDLKVFLRTFSDATGITKLGQHIKQHSIVVKGLASAYKATGAAGKAAFSLISSQLRMIRNAAAVTAAALTGIGIKGVSAFMKQDDAAKSLAASLTSLGYNADSLMPQFTRLADEIQRLTRIGDDQTLGLAGTLLNFGVTPEKIEPAIRGTIGLATAMRMDLGSAAQYLALAYEGQFTMLARYIPALRTATDDAEKMAIVQGVMARGFEQAQASAGTLAGRWDQLRNRIGDLWERIGQAVSEALNLSGAFGKAEGAVKSLIESAVWDRITTGLRNAVGYVVTQVKTAYDLVAYLRSQDFGMARLAEVGKTVVVELITMAVTLLLALLKANMAVFIGLVKMVAAVFKKEIFDVLRMIPFLKQQVSKMAYDKVQGLSKDEGNELVRSLGFSSGREMADSQAFKSGSLDSAIAAFQSSAGVVKAMSETAGKLEKTLKDVDAQWEKSKENIRASGRKASGGEFDWDQRAAGNRAELETFFNDKPAPAAPTGPTRAELERRAAAARRQLQEMEWKRQEADAVSKISREATPEEQRFSQWQQQNKGRKFASNSFSAREGEQLSASASTSRAAADQSAAEAAEALVSITAMIRDLSTRLKDVEGQIRNAP